MGGWRFFFGGVVMRVVGSEVFGVWEGGGIALVGGGGGREGRRLEGAAGRVGEEW